jgi:5-methylcytosine-specific restriction endonuclease McrA
MASDVAWADRRDEVMLRDSLTCQRCGRTFEDSRPLEAAHIVARAEGGSDEPDNLRALCIACHSDVDGWDVGDFENSNRVRRVASYVSHVERLGGAALVSRSASLLGVDYDRAAELLEERW